MRASSRSVTRGRRVETAVKVALLLFVIVYAFFPIVWVVSAALNPANTLINQSLIPPDATLDNFRRLFDEGMATNVHPYRPFALWIWNSLKVSTISAVIIVTLTALAGYSFSRFRYRYRRQALLTILLIQLFPNLLAIVSLFLLLQLIGSVFPALGLNSHGGLILVYTGGALGFNTWLMKGYFDSIPRSLDESALMDGANRLQILRYILFPLIRPVLVVIALLTFIGTYSDFILARTLLKSADEYTFAVGLTFFIRGAYQNEWGAFAAAALIGAVPIVLLFFVLQRQLVGGLTAGAVKG